MTNTITTDIWQEIPSVTNPFRPDRCLCSGYDVYGDLIQQASWIEYLYLLFKRERPNGKQAKLFNGISIALANFGPRDPSIHAAMAAGAVGCGAGASLIAAIGPAAGQLGGAHEVARLVENFQEMELDTENWLIWMGSCNEQTKPWTDYEDVWPHSDHPPGLDPYAESASLTTLKALEYLASISPGEHLTWLEREYKKIERHFNKGISLAFVAAAGLRDLMLDPEQAEMIYLLLRLPGAAAHSLECRYQGWKSVAFYENGLNLVDNPHGIGGYK